MISSEKISEVAELLRTASRPLFVWGSGVRGYRDTSLALARSLGVPVACTWGCIDLLNHDDPLNCGGFGTHGTRAANFAVQNSDLLICLGCRLDTKATGTPAHFARAAKIVMVDIDSAEILKFEKLGRKIDIGICADVGEFLEAFPVEIPEPHERAHLLRFNWKWKIQAWKERYKPQGPAYDLMRRIGEHSSEKDTIVSGTGNTLGWIMQGFPFKGERFIHAFNFTPMGYGLAGAVGAAFASSGRVICIVGDGDALMSVNELATIARHNLNIKIILLDNKGHAMCRHTQRQWLGGNYYATSIEGGLGFPDWEMISSAFDIPLEFSLEGLFGGVTLPDGNPFSGPSFMVASIDEDESLAFQARFGAPIEDNEPLMPWEDLKREMIIEPLRRES